MKQSAIEKFKKEMKTAGSKKGYLSQRFYTGVQGITVKMIDHSKNPYRSIYEMALSCWGHYIEKWETSTPEQRFFIVCNSLFGNTLPLALESPQFTFAIEGCSRASFDQIARARLGVCFSAMGVRDNSHYNFPFRIPNSISENKSLQNEVEQIVKRINQVYDDIVKYRNGNWQAARCILPMNMCYNFSMSINLLSLINLCSKRMSFCEQEDTVAVAWLLRNEMSTKFPLLSYFLMPACDRVGKCLYSQNYKMSSLFGELFSPCHRNPSDNKKSNPVFNSACSDSELIGKQLGIDISKAVNFSHKKIKEMIESIYNMLDDNYDGYMVNQVIADTMGDILSEKDYKLFKEN